MSGIAGQVATRNVKWKKPPRGNSGEGLVEIDGREYSVRWKTDAEGLWIELPHGVFGFDIHGEPDENEGSGSVYRVSQRGTDVLYSGVRFKGAGETAAQAGSAGKKKTARVRAQMPGKIVRVTVKEGDRVEKDQPILVMEAMKMENEIRAPQAGVVESVKVSEGQAVESGADLVHIGAGEA